MKHLSDREIIIRLIDIVARLDERIDRIERDINRLLNRAATFVQLTQDGESMGQITGTPIGGTSTFTALFLQGQGKAAGTLQSGNIPVWSSLDANVAITPSADGTQASVALAAAETAATYDLTVSAINSDGNPITNTFTVPVLPAVVVPPPPPPDTAATFIDLQQNS